MEDLSLETLDLNSPPKILKPVDYRFWRFVSSLVGERGHLDRGTLVGVSCLAIMAINEDEAAIVKAMRSFRIRLAACIEAHRQLFEYIYRTMKDCLTALANNP